MYAPSHDTYLQIDSIVQLSSSHNHTNIRRCIHSWRKTRFPGLQQNANSLRNLKQLTLHLRIFLFIVLIKVSLVSSHISQSNEMLCCVTCFPGPFVSHVPGLGNIGLWRLETPDDGLSSWHWGHLHSHRRVLGANQLPSIIMICWRTFILSNASKFILTFYRSASLVFRNCP